MSNIANESTPNMEKDEEMLVTKRDGNTEVIAFDKILKRIRTLGNEANIKINYTSLVMKVIDQIYNNISTTKIDELSAEQCASMSTIHPDYNVLAGRIVVSNHHKNTSASFVEVMNQLYTFKDKHGVTSPLVSKELHDIVNEHGEAFENMIDYNNDYLIDYFGFKTLERAYLMKLNGKIIERPQHMWLRVSIGIHGNNLEKIKETYNYMSSKYFTHATPTLFNAGTPHPQLSSCYLISMENDSIDGIYNTLKDCALISKWAGGIGLHIHNIRASGSHIRGTNGSSNGIVPMLRVFNHTAKYVDQGGGKRNGSFAMYLEPWHADIEAFLEMRKNHGEEDLRARDLFYALWTPDLFMERVKSGGDWTLMCPDECPGLSDVYGEDFKELYEKYESEGKGRKTMKARDLWFQVLDAQMETGTPYLLYKDSVNRKSNQANLGTIKSSNLCCEITEYSNSEETAVCNLASIALPAFVKLEDENKIKFDFEELHKVTKVVTNNLNNIIDVNFYPTDKTRRSNMRHRPIGIGVQGLADVFFKMNLPFHSDEAKQLNKDIFETMYHAAVEQSNEIAIERYHAVKENSADNLFNEYEQPLLDAIQDNATTVGSYSSFVGSPMSKGIFQFDMWKVTPSTRYDWDALKESIMKYGTRNSLLMAPMPTASTSQILGYNECIEPITSNIYSRRTIAGEFVLANKYLMNDLIKLELWNEKMKNNIVANKGSIQHLDAIPQEIRDKYKTVWEMPMRHLIDMAADRGAYICQSQSLNLWLEDPNYSNLTSMHFYSWSKGLKTGIYYLRRRARHQAQQFTIEPEKAQIVNPVEDVEDEICEMCSA
jgi:ribonucleotide reductase alpha subunit|uniref:ribonucleoside-diphosphate reductase n=1 Tax=viral metagenome TaxID=1070528 RepID=A0A6C0ISQ0_9ZZZZ